jgi:CDP-glycerol glycerophosphotransferase
VLERRGRLGLRRSRVVESNGRGGTEAALGVPDVSVVVPVYNDPLVEQAIASALDQTLRTVEVVVVDHGSTDGTSELLDGIAAREPRVRVFHLPDNEGGPGRPLNAGMDAAAGRYITILGSDDELEPDACRTLLGAGDVETADLVTSMTRRILVHENNAVRRWYPALYSRRRSLQGIRSDLEQIWDQIPVGKLFRTQWVRNREIVFPEDVVYEDQLFMMKAYLRAGRIAVVPEPTYRWMIRPKAARTSITHGRANVQNLLDRMTVNERIDTLIAEEGADDIKPWKDRKFLRHDLKLYLHELWRRDKQYQQTFADVVGGYLKTIPDETLAAEPPLVRVSLWLLRQGDVEGALSAYAYVVGRGRVAAPLVRRDGRVYWTGGDLDTEEARRWLDVTDVGLDRLPPSLMHLYNDLDFVGGQDDTVAVRGSVLNQLGVIPDDAAVKLHVVVKPRRGGRSFRFEARDVSRAGDRIAFSATLDLGRRVDLGLSRTQLWDVYVETAWDGQVNLTRTAACAEAWPDVAVAVASRRGVLVGDTLTPYGTATGDLSFQLTQSSLGRVRLGDTAGRVLRSTAVRKARRTYTSGIAPRAKQAYFEACKRLPVQRGLVLFESFEGRQYSDSPRAVYEALRRMHPEIQAVWSYSSWRGSSGFPKDASLVRRGSYEYFKVLATAEYWVDNFGFPKAYPPRAETTYVQTWHGTPLKTLFFDTPRVRDLSPEEKDGWQEFVDRWDYVVIPNDYYASTFLRSTNTRALPIRAGLPRNDVLVNGNDPATVERLKRELGLPTDRRIVLYAPTYRSRPLPGAPTFRYPDVAELAEALGEEHFLLLRQHYYRPAMRVPPSLAWFARDVSKEDEMANLLLVSDVLVTDYSSVAFDYGLLRRPMVFYAPDLDHYSHVDPRTYLDLADVAPGPIVESTEELIEAVRRSRDGHGSYAEAYEAFYQRFCGAENGRGAETVVEQVWGPSRAGGQAPS